MAFSRERGGGDREESDHMGRIEEQAETSRISLRKWEVLKVLGVLRSESFKGLGVGWRRYGFAQTKKSLSQDQPTSFRCVDARSCTHDADISRSHSFFSCLFEDSESGRLLHPKILASAPCIYVKMT